MNAFVSGASRGLGLALASELARQGWSIVVDARHEDELNDAVAQLPNTVVVPGDVTDPSHRREVARTVRNLGTLDLVVNNASLLGPSPQPNLYAYPLDVLRHVYEVNLVAPLALFQDLYPFMRNPGGVLVNITSDAAVEGYAGWGGYGSSKAALEHLSRVLAAEHPELRIYWVDPGDMNTRMQQDAFPGEDISDRPTPDASVPGILALIEGSYPSGRYQARQVAEPT